MYENVKVVINEKMSKEQKPYTAVELIFPNGERVTAGFAELAKDIYWANRPKERK